MKKLCILAFTASLLSGCTSGNQPNGGTATLNAADNFSVQQPVGDLSVKVWSPDRSQNGLKGLMVQLTGSDGRPVSGAQVTAHTSMPSMNMPGPTMIGKEQAPGSYSLPGTLMTGDWQIDLSVKEPKGAVDTEHLHAQVP